jgi:hypothetical protein
MLAEFCESFFVAAIHFVMPSRLVVDCTARAEVFHERRSIPVRNFLVGEKLRINSRKTCSSCLLVCEALNISYEVPSLTFGHYGTNPCLSGCVSNSLNLQYRE